MQSSSLSSPALDFEAKRSSASPDSDRSAQEAQKRTPLWKFESKGFQNGTEAYVSQGL